MNINDNSTTDTVYFSLKQNWTVNWITSLDFGNFNDQSEDFSVDNSIYGVLSGGDQLFWIFNLNYTDGFLNAFNWFNYTKYPNTNSIIFSVVSCAYH